MLCIKHTPPQLLNPFLLRRFFVTLKRKYPLSSPSLTWSEGVVSNLPVKHQVYEATNAECVENNSLKVLLAADVPGLGAMGTLVNVHRNRFWRYLYPLRLAELPTPQRISHFQNMIKDRSPVLFGDAYELGKRLERMTLYVPMNPARDWTLNKTHIRVAFRKCGIIISEDAIRLPSEPVTRDSSAFPFTIIVKVDDVADVPVQCRIFGYQKLDKFTCTQPPTDVFKPLHLDDWEADFPESELRSPRN